MLLSATAAVIAIFSFVTGVYSVEELWHLLQGSLRQQPSATEAAKRSIDQTASASDQTASASASKPATGSDLSVINAIYHRDTEAATSLLRGGAELNYLDNDGVSPLYVAMINCNPELMEMLLEHGADPDLRLRDGDTVVIKSSELGYLPETNTLLKYNASIDIRSRGRTAIVAAASSGHYTVAKLLREKGANVDTRGREDLRETPLMEAVRANDLEQVAIYLKLGADVTLVNSAGLTAVGIAKDIHSPRTARDFEEYVYFTSNGRSLRLRKEKMIDAQARRDLSKSIETRSFEEAMALLEANILLKESDLFLAVEHAQEQADIKLLEALVARGLDLNSRGSYGKTLLMSAAGKPYVMQFLLAAKAVDVDAKDSKGATALMYSFSSREEVKLLLEAEADIDLKDGSGKTVLDYAIGACFDLHHQDARAVVELIIRYGADVNTKDGAGNTPLMRLIEESMRKSVCGSSLEVAELLLEGGAGEELTKATEEAWATRGGWVTDTYQLVLDLQSEGVFPCRKELRQLIESHIKSPIGYGWRRPALELEEG